MLHKEQCFHRDIAPDNILLTTRGPLLLDFGAARRLIGDMTHALTVVLKPGYAPIEQYGEAAAMVQGPWTDLYALASVVHYAITGQAPTSSVERIMEDTLQPLAQRAAGRYSDGFLKAIDGALAVRPTERPQDVAQFCAMLNAGVPADSPELFRTTDVRSSRYQSSDVDTQTVEPTRQRTSPPPATRTETLAAQCLETVPAPPVYVAAAAAPGSASRSRRTLLVAAALGVLVVMGGAMVAIRSIGPSNDAARTPVPQASKPVVPLPPARVAVDRAPPGIAGTSAAWPPDKPVAIPVPPRLPTRAAVEASTPNRGMKPVRCSDILQRASLEPLTAEEAAYLRRECR